MFKCKGCLAKDRYIASLELQIRQWQKLALPQREVEDKVAEIEANAILTGTHDIIDVAPLSDKIAQDREIEDDFHKIITGA